MKIFFSKNVHSYRLSLFKGKMLNLYFQTLSTSSVYDNEFNANMPDVHVTCHPTDR